MKWNSVYQFIECYQTVAGAVIQRDAHVGFIVGETIDPIDNQLIKFVLGICLCS